MKADGVYEGKKIQVILKNNFHFNGRVIRQEGGYLTIIDKYNKEVLISLSDVMLLEVVG